MSDKLNSKNIADYLSTFPELVLEILEDPELEHSGTAKLWASRVLYRNVPNNEMVHGLATTLALKHLVPDPTPKQLKDAYVYGWCLQMFASCYFILDDIFDNSTTRHYKPCWHLVDNLGAKALNDVALLESCVYRLLKRHFGHRDFYPAILTILHDLSLKMALSQNLELHISRNQASSFEDRFSWQQYKTLVSYKMCYYPTWIHFLGALHLSGLDKQARLQSLAKPIFQKIDFHFQPRDDYLDVYGDNKSNEAETGSDIEEGRCSWNIVTALQAADDRQKAVLVSNYGRKHGLAAVKVKSVYDQIDLSGLYDRYETVEYEQILSLIKQLPEELPQELLLEMMWASFPNKRQTIKKTDRGADAGSTKSLVNDVPDFLGLFPELVLDVLADTGHELSELEGWIGHLFHYNVPHGKKTRGLTIPLAYRMLNDGRVSTAEMKKCYILGWCLEMLQAAALIADDVMDNSSMRRGRPCWYKRDEVGLAALNDATLLESAIYKILRKHFGAESYYPVILELFQDVTYKTAHGQALDVQTGLSTDIRIFTRERYDLIVKYKTSYYTFILPIQLSLAMFGVDAQNLMQTQSNFLLDIGHFFQVQDDFLDCFGDVGVTGKVGTDIEDGKCSWLVVEALERVTTEERQLLVDNYGKHDAEAVDVVKKMYKNMELQQVFYDFEAETYKNLKEKLEEMDVLSAQHKQLLLKILQTTEKRIA